MALYGLQFAQFEGKLRSERQLPRSQTLHEAMAPSLASWAKRQSHLQDLNSPLW